MKSSTDTLIKALAILANDVQSEDGVANACIFEASQRLQEQEKRIAELEQIALAVAHIGVDFGYGAYEIDQETIDKARKLIDKGGDV